MTDAKPAPKVWPPPPFPLLHCNVTVDQFMTPFPAPGPWTVSVNAPTPASTSNDYQTLSAYLRGGYLQTTYKINKPSFPKGLSFGLQVTKSAQSAKPEVSPTVYYKFEKDGENTISFAPKTGRLSHTWMHDKGTFTSDMNANLYDYLTLDGSVNARLYPGWLGGFDFVYDPTRSGLKSWRIGLKNRMTHAISYDGTGTLAFSTLHTFIPGRLQAALNAKYTRSGYEATVGAAAFSPCGAKLSAKVQVHDGAAAAGISRIIGGSWRINVAVHGNVYKKTYNGVGLSFSYDQ